MATMMSVGLPLTGASGKGGAAAVSLSAEIVPSQLVFHQGAVSMLSLQFKLVNNGAKSVDTKPGSW
jgi:hypothetical protein